MRREFRRARFCADVDHRIANASGFGEKDSSFLAMPSASALTSGFCE